MRVFLFVLTSVTAFSALAAAPVLGTLKKVSAALYLHESDNTHCEKWSIEAANSEALAQLKKLNSGDEITGSGTYNDAICVVKIHSIEYVGLRRMLGVWLSSDGGLVSIRDFSSMRFYPAVTQVWNDAYITPLEPQSFSYSVVPSEGREWVVFLSNSEGAFFSTLLFTKGQAIMKIYDSDNGNLTRTLHLSKWNTRNK